MACVRSVITMKDRKGGHFPLANTAAQDRRLSPQAIGIVALMLSLPPDHHFTSKWLHEWFRGRITRRPLDEALDELERHGYFRKIRLPGAHGHWGWTQVFSDDPEALNERYGPVQTAPDETPETADMGTSGADPDSVDNLGTTIPESVDNEADHLTTVWSDGATCGNVQNPSSDHLTTRWSDKRQSTDLESTVHARGRETAPPVDHVTPNMTSMIIEELRIKTGRTITREHAAAVARQILGRARGPVPAPAAYVRTSIQRDEDPLRFVPSSDRCAAIGRPAADLCRRCGGTCGERCSHLDEPLALADAFAGLGRAA